MIVTIYYWFKDKREDPVAFGQSFSILRAAEGKIIIELYQLFWFIVQSTDVLSDFILFLSSQAWKQTNFKCYILLIESHTCTLTQFPLALRCTARLCSHPFQNQEGPCALVLTDRIEWEWQGSQFSWSHTYLNNHLKSDLTHLIHTY